MLPEPAAIAARLVLELAPREHLLGHPTVPLFGIRGQNGQALGQHVGVQGTRPVFFALLHEDELEGLVGLRLADDGVVDLVEAVLLDVLAGLLAHCVVEARHAEEGKLGLHGLRLVAEQVGGEFAKGALAHHLRVTVVYELDFNVAAARCGHHFDAVPEVICTEKGSTERASHDWSLELSRRFGIELLHRIVYALVLASAIHPPHMETVRVLHVCHLDADALQVLIPRVGAGSFILCLEIQLTAPDSNRLLPRAVFCLLHLVEESRPLVYVAALEVSLSQAFLAKLDRKVRTIGHLHIAEEGAALVGKDELDGDFALVKVRSGQPQRVVSVLKQRRLVFVLSHGTHTKQIDGDHAAFLLQSHLKLHATKAMLNNTAERLVFPLEHHRFILFRLLRILSKVSEDGHRGRLGRVMQT